MSNLDTKEKTPQSTTNSPIQDKYDQVFDDMVGNYDKETEHPLGAQEAKSIVDSNSANTNGAENDIYNTAASGDTNTELTNKLAGFVKRNPKKSGAIGGVFGVILAGSFILIPMLGPLQFLHFSSLLQGIFFSDQNNTSHLRLRKIVQYSKFAQGKAGIEETRMGRVAAHRTGAIDKKLAKSGLTSTFSTDGTGKFQGFDIDTSKLPDDLKNDRKKLAKHFNVNVNDLDVDGKHIKISADGTRKNRKLISKALKASPDYNKFTSAFAKRRLIKRANLSYNPITRVKEAVKTKAATKYKAWREARENRLKGKDVDVKATSRERAEDTSDRDSSSKRTHNSSLDEADDILDDKPKSKSDLSKKFTSKLTAKGAAAGAGAAVGALAVIQAVCMVSDISSEASDQKTLQKLGAMAQVASESLSVASKVKAGNDVDYETIGQYNKSMHGTKRPDDVPEEVAEIEEAIDDYEGPQYSVTGGSAFAASTILKATTPAVDRLRTLDALPEVNPDDKSGVDHVANFFSAVPGLDATCGVINTFGDWFSGVLEFVTLGKSTEAIEAALGPVMDWMFGMLSGEAANLASSEYAGEVFGEAASVGALLMANESAMANGQPLLSDKQNGDLQAFTADQKYLNDDRSFLAKMFDLSDVDSVASKTAISTYDKSNSEMVASLPSVLFGNAMGLFSPTASASDGGVINSLTRDDTYGVAKAGIHPAILLDKRFEDPYSNTVKAKQALVTYPDLQGYIEDCHKVTINPEDMSAETLGSEEAPYKYMTNGSTCEDPQNGNTTWTAGDEQLSYAPLERNKTIFDDIASMFGGKKAYAANKYVPGATSATLTGAQTAYYSVMFALTDTEQLLALDCIEFNGEESCNEIMPAQNTASSGGEVGQCPANPSVFDEKNLKPDSILVGRCASEKWPEIEAIGGYRPDGGPVPDHPNGLAVDIMIPGGCTVGKPDKIKFGDEIANFFKDNAKDYGVKYIMWNNQIWNSESDGNNFRTIASRGGCNENHQNHIHITTYGDKATLKPGGSGGIVGDIGKSSKDVPCADGTENLGIVESLYTGAEKSQSGPLMTRLCRIKQIPGGGDNKKTPENRGAVVNSRVSAAWLALAKAAQKDKVGLVAGSSFRYADSCGGTGDGTACARPGKSAHQLGMAIDFNNMPGKGSSTSSCEGRATPNTKQWNWMYENAEQFGVKQYTYEGWHWDLLDAANRCGEGEK